MLPSFSPQPLPRISFEPFTTLCSLSPPVLPTTNVLLSKCLLMLSSSDSLDEYFFYFGIELFYASIGHLTPRHHLFHRLHGCRHQCLLLREPCESPYRRSWLLEATRQALFWPLKEEAKVLRFPFPLSVDRSRIVSAPARVVARGRSTCSTSRTVSKSWKKRTRNYTKSLTTIFPRPLVWLVVTAPFYSGNQKPQGGNIKENGAGILSCSHCHA